VTPRPLAPALIACLAAACATPTEGASESGAESSGASTAAAATGSSTDDGTGATGSGTGVDASSSGEAGGSSESSSGGDVELQHGIVQLRLRASAGRPADPFAGTSRIEVTMTYEQCLFAFYAAHPEWAQDGTQGEDVFGPQASGGEGWLDRLCEVPVADLVDCEVETLAQQLDPIPVLRVSYAVSEPLEDRVLPFGPLPGAALAACEGGTMPTVRLVNGDAIRGFDGVTAIWRAQTFDPDSAATDQAPPIEVAVEAL
jgi:hypothetical protein